MIVTPTTTGKRVEAATPEEHDVIDAVVEMLRDATGEENVRHGESWCEIPSRYWYAKRQPRSTGRI